MKVKSTKAMSIQIFIAGDHAKALVICQQYCNEVGLCVTVEPTTYVYTHGAEVGVRIGLINYARFPTTRKQLWDKGYTLALRLKKGLDQGSFTIQDAETSEFFSTREGD